MNTQNKEIHRLSYYIISLRRNNSDCNYLSPMYFSNIDKIDSFTGKLEFKFTNGTDDAFAFFDKTAAVNFVNEYLMKQYGKDYIIQIVLFSVERTTSVAYVYEQIKEKK